MKIAVSLALLMVALALAAVETVETVAKVETVPLPPTSRAAAADDIPEPWSGASRRFLAEFGGVCDPLSRWPGVGGQLAAGPPLVSCRLQDGSAGVRRLSVLRFNPLERMPPTADVRRLAPLPIVDGHDRPGGGGAAFETFPPAASAAAAQQAMAAQLQLNQRLLSSGRYVQPDTASAMQAQNGPSTVELQEKGQDGLMAALAQCGCANYTVSRTVSRLSRFMSAAGLDRSEGSRVGVGEVLPGCTPEPPILCDATSRYRTITGECNNLQHPRWGRAVTGQRRILPDTYDDGVFSPRRLAVDGSPLPSARAVTAAVLRSRNTESPHANTLMTVLGLFLALDFVQTPVRKLSGDVGLECCADDGATLPDSPVHPECLPIEIPADDPFYAPYSQRCMNFVRSLLAPNPECRARPSTPLNALSSFIDVTTVYGDSEQTERLLREFSGGRLRDNGGLLPSRTPRSRRRRSQVSTSRGNSTRSLHAHSREPVYSSETQAETERRAPTRCPHARSHFPSLSPPGHGQGCPGCSWQVSDGPPPLPTDQSCGTGCAGCTCFDAGASRVNLQPQLAVLHTVWLREHNRVAADLACRHRRWSDERLFQEARRIVSAELQHITYNEFLPTLLGQHYSLRHGLAPLTRGFLRHYSPAVRADLSVEVIAAALRYGHSEVQDVIELVSATGKTTPASMVAGFLEPSLIVDREKFVRVARGLLNQPTEQVDGQFDRAVFGDLFRPSNKPFGMDLAAINIQRGRDHGAPTYVQMAEHCLRRSLSSWDSLRQLMPDDAVNLLRGIYTSHQDVDLYMGGIFERHADGAQVGPTFQCLIGDTFFRTRFGDRFWYENGRMAHSFSAAQLRQIRRASLARVLCDTLGPRFTEVYPLALSLPSHLNRKVSCYSLAVPEVDLSVF